VRKNGYATEQGVVTGVAATDQLPGKIRRIKVKAVIHCRGPWATRDKMFIATTPVRRQPKRMARAVNLVINGKLSSCRIL